MIKGVVKGRSLTIIGTDGDVFTSGSVGLKIKVTFDDEWDGLVKQAVFQNGSNAYISTAINDEFEVPLEALSIPGRVLRIGIRGTNGTTLVIPTIYAECRIYEGSDKNGAAGQEWSPSEVDQVLSVVAAIDNKVGDLDDLDTTDKSSVVNAINEVFGKNSSISTALKQALLQLAQKVGYIDDSGPSCYMALYNALYQEYTIVSIDAVFTQGTNVVYDTDSLDSLKQYLVVTANYSNETSEVVTAYTLSGTLSVGESTITVSYMGKTDIFTVTVTELTPVFQLSEATSTNDYDTEIELFDTAKSFTILCEFTFNNYSWSGSKSLFGHAGFRLGYGTIDDYVDGAVIASNTSRFTAVMLNPSSVSNHYRGTALVARTNGSQTRRFAVRYDHTTRKCEGFVYGDSDREVPTVSWFITADDVVYTDGRTIKLNINSSGSTANEFEIYTAYLPDSRITAFLEGGT